MRKLLAALILLLASTAIAQGPMGGSASLPKPASDGQCLVSSGGKWVAGACSGTAGLYTAANNATFAAGNKAATGTCTFKVNTSDQIEADCPLKIGGSGADIYTPIADGTTANSLWLSSTTANRFKAYLNSVTQTFAFQSDSVSTLAAASATVTTATPVTVSTTDSSGFYFNQHATAATAITYNLPTAAAGKQFCFANSNNGAANTGALTIATSAAGQYIIYTDGTLSASGGNIASGGAAGDAACMVGVDSTHWIAYVQRGTWTKN